jgi:hypothetical protein
MANNTQKLSINVPFDQGNTFTSRERPQVSQRFQSATILFTFEASQHDIDNGSICLSLSSRGVWRQTFGGLVWLPLSRKSLVSSLRFWRRLAADRRCFVQFTRCAVLFGITAHRPPPIRVDRSNNKPREVRQLPGAGAPASSPPLPPSLRL